MLRGKFPPEASGKKESLAFQYPLNKGRTWNKKSLLTNMLSASGTSRLPSGKGKEGSHDLLAAASRASVLGCQGESELGRTRAGFIKIGRAAGANCLCKYVS